MKTSNIIGMGLITVIINSIIYAGLFCGGVYFVFWCLRHFGVIGG